MKKKTKKTDKKKKEEEEKKLRKQIKELKSILESEKKLLQTIKNDLRKIKKTFASPRRTLIEDEIEEITVDIEVTVTSEDVLISITREGYIKRTSLRSYAASNGEDFAMREDDYLIKLMEINTTDHILLFTNKCRYIYLPVHELPDISWKDIGQHISNIISIERDEFIVQSFPIRDVKTDDFLIFFTKNGMIKKSELKLYEAQRYSRALIAMNLKEEDELISVSR